MVGLRMKISTFIYSKLEEYSVVLTRMGSSINDVRVYGGRERFEICDAPYKLILFSYKKSYYGRGGGS